LFLRWFFRFHVATAGLDITGILCILLSPMCCLGRICLLCRNDSKRCELFPLSSSRWSTSLPAPKVLCLPLFFPPHLVRNQSPTNFNDPFSQCLLLFFPNPNVPFFLILGWTGKLTPCFHFSSCMPPDRGLVCLLSVTRTPALFWFCVDRCCNCHP